LKILIVAMSNSIHTARWISQISDQGWDIYLFPTDIFVGIHEKINKINICSPGILKFLIRKYKEKGKSKSPGKIENLETLLYQNNHNLNYKDIIKRFLPDNRLKKLVRTIKNINPDIIHSMHVQEAGYLTLEAKKKIKDRFPDWIVTNWGSEISLFRHIQGQEEKIKDVLAECDYFSSECKRDMKIVKGMGFKGRFLPVIPNSAGLDFEIVNNIKQPGPTSKRRNIMLKGYQNWAGRALVGLRAIERCSDIIKDYNIMIYCAYTIDIIIAAELFTKRTGIKTEIIPLNTKHEDILRYHGEARISIGLSITDAISTSLLEAMVMGSFPIQSNTSCGDEWFKNNDTGILVHPEDAEEIEKAIRKAIKDNRMVDEAAIKNYSILYKRLEKEKIKSEIINNYKRIISD